MYCHALCQSRTNVTYSCKCKLSIICLTVSTKSFLHPCYVTLRYVWAITRLPPLWRIVLKWFQRRRGRRPSCMARPATATISLTVETVQPQGIINWRSCRRSASDPRWRYRSTTHRRCCDTSADLSCRYFDWRGVINKRCVLNVHWNIDTLRLERWGNPPSVTPSSKNKWMESLPRCLMAMFTVSRTVTSHRVVLMSATLNWHNERLTPNELDPFIDTRRSLTLYVK